MSRSVRCATLLLFSFLAVNVYAPHRMIDFWGGAVEYGDRPLVIGSYKQSLEFFRDIEMKEVGNSIGFLDYAAIQPFMLPANMSKAEVRTIEKSRRWAQVSASADEPIQFNGRVILDTHGLSDGSMMVEYGDEKINIGKANEVAGKIFSFLKDRGIVASTFDLVGCDGKIGQRFLFGAEMKGVTNVEVRAYRGTVYVTRAEDIPPHSYMLVVDKPAGFQSEEITVGDYLLRNKPIPVPDEYRQFYSLGKPDPVPAIEPVPVSESCTPD